MRKSTIPEWAVSTRSREEADSGDEFIPDVQLIGRLVESGSAMPHDDMSPSERMTADRLLRMGVLIEATADTAQVKLAEPWRRVLESLRKKAQVPP